MLKIPFLKLFDEKISHYKLVQQEISRVTPSIDILWVRVTLLPLKNSLNRRLTTWINTYTSFLTKQYMTLSKNLKDFIESTRIGIQHRPSAEEHQEDKPLLMKTMKIISDVKEVEIQIPGIVQRMKQMVALLKKQGIVVQERDSN